jgi:hypothetical protein
VRNKMQGYRLRLEKEVFRLLGILLMATGPTGFALAIWTRPFPLDNSLLVAIFSFWLATELGGISLLHITNHKSSFSD